MRINPKYLTSALGAIVASFILVACSNQQTEYADTIYFNGQIYTLNETQPWAQAVAIKDGKFLYVGNKNDALKFKSEDTEVHDLKNKMAMPGIADLHIHPVYAGINELYDCVIRTRDSVPDIVAKVASCAQKGSDEDWIQGGKWNLRFLRDKYYLNRKLLDEVAPNRPVFLFDASSHNGWLNSKALELVGITDDTPNPKGGEIVRDPKTGKATGLLLETAYKNARQKVPRDPTHFLGAAKWAVKELNSYGILAFKDALAGANTIRAYAEADKSGEMTARVTPCYGWNNSLYNSDEKRQEFVEDELPLLSTKHVKTDCVKITIDGVPPAFSAVFLQPYLKNKAHGAEFYGEFGYDPEQLKRDLVRFDAAGIAVKIHTGGDAALRAGLDAVENARKANGPDGPRHEVAHTNFISEQDIPRLAELNVAGDLSPAFWYPSPVINAIAGAIGPKRAEHIFPIKTLLAANAPLIYGSDWPAAVPSSNPWPGIEAMVTRKDPYGKNPGQLWAEEAVSLEDALKITTINGAESMGISDITGSIEAGKSADMIVLDRHLFEINADDIGGTQIQVAMFEGKELFRKD